MMLLTCTEISVVELVGLSEPIVFYFDQMAHIWDAKRANSIPNTDDLNHGVFTRTSDC